jgi:NAD(P)-dependent dehydrogenase (short-subunit alcohol dehydrogenase family)
MPSDLLAGKVAIVTGGASGMGAASARGLASEGARVVVADVDRTGIDRTAAEIIAGGGDALAFAVDVTSADEVNNLVEFTVDQYQTIDILACIAGVLRSTGVDEITEAEWRLVLDVNLTGVFLSIQAVLPLMKEQNAGRIVVMGSMAGRATSTLGGAHYTASKAGVLGLTRHVAREVGPYGINVNAINPGIIDTPMIRASTSDEQLDGVIDSIPFNRMGSPEEVADLVVFLASDKASYITGAGIDIHGGEIII